MAYRSTLRNETLKDALENFIVPPVINKFKVSYLRTLWDVTDGDVNISGLNIWSKREQISKIITSFQAVRLFFSCLTAMESAKYREEYLKRKRQISNNRTIDGSDTDNDYDTFTDSSRLIPGKNHVFHYSLQVLPK